MSDQEKSPAPDVETLYEMMKSAEQGLLVTAREHCHPCSTEWLTRFSMAFDTYGHAQSRYIEASILAAEARGRNEHEKRDYVDWGSGELLAMTALDNYLPDEGIHKSTSVVFRIHQLGHAFHEQAETIRQLREEVERQTRNFETFFKKWAEAEGKAHFADAQSPAAVRAALEGLKAFARQKYCATIWPASEDGYKAGEGFAYSLMEAEIDQRLAALPRKS